MNDDILKEAQKAIERNRETQKMSVKEWARRLAYSQVEHEENLPEKDRTRAIKPKIRI